MMTYIFTDSDGETLEIGGISRAPKIVITTSGYSVNVPDNQVPELVLNMLEAAGFGAGSEVFIGDAVMELRKHLFAVKAEAARLADMEAEADRNALEAEAQRFYETWAGGERGSGVAPYRLLGERSKQKWRDVALTARRINQDGAA
ncbi:hypothetical protein UM93_14525 [Psychromicrobium lacuslunae]|uniref:Uncharacterized protein n=2 Tax=Psychromicrobium lacuslunae TaxID=1618207 RepID=A0A0D4C1D6_9MICC|nr:hypothetical protein UM93_14525 [Psychromicrobium lacuslunae]